MNVNRAFDHGNIRHRNRKQPISKRLDFTQIGDQYHDGQRALFELRQHYPDVQFEIVLAGKQSGKTVIGPDWLLREIQLRGPGDYVVMAPRHTLLLRKPRPMIIRKFVTELQLFQLHAKDNMLELRDDAMERLWGTSDRQELYRRFAKRDVDADGNEVVVETLEQFPTSTRVLFLHTTDPENLEAGTYKAGWYDECGMKAVSEESWVALANRFIAYKGRVLMTTTPYVFGYFKRNYCDPCKHFFNGKFSQFFCGASEDGYIAMIRFESWLNPMFGMKEYLRKKLALPPWLFDMNYRGIFTKPLGQYYSCWDTSRHVIVKHQPPPGAKIIVGCDFGPINFAAVAMYLDEVRCRAVVYAVYCPGANNKSGHAPVRKTTAEHTANVLRMCGNRHPDYCFGGNASENEWRKQFKAEGLHIRKPSILVPETRRQGVYGLLAEYRLVFMEHVTHMIREMESLSWELDDDGHVTDVIDNESSFHRHAALTYAAPEVEKLLKSLYEELQELHEVNIGHASATITESEG